MKPTTTASDDYADLVFPDDAYAPDCWINAAAVKELSTELKLVVSELKRHGPLLRKAA